MLSADAILNPLEVPRNCVSLETELGKGHFGIVVKGTLTTMDGNIPVAVKFLKDDADQYQCRSFRVEASRLAEAKHRNIIQLKAVCFDSSPACLIVELAENGNLRSYLQHCNENYRGRLRTAQLTKLCLDASCGFSYLAEQRLVHRDLACRNLLLMADFTVKIGDFGLFARDLVLADAVVD